MSKFNITTDNVAICILMYGSYVHLHKRILASLKKCAPKNAHIYIWCNQVGLPTKKLLHEAHLHFDNLRTHFSDDNVPKYPVMRQMLDMWNIDTDSYGWMCWFDDDAELTDSNWWSRMAEYIRAREAENVCYIGGKYYIHLRGNQSEFYKTRPWYRGLPYQLEKTRHGSKQPAAVFCTGGYWWLRLDVMEQIGWPDPLLSHNGGDTMLGVAVHQQGLPLHNFTAGVAINKAPRRGISEKRLGE